MYHFKQSVCFPGKKGGKDAKGHVLPDEPSRSYKLGDVCDVPKDVEDHPYFLALVKSGSVCEAEAPPPPQESAEARAKRLHDKLTGKPEAAKEPEKPKDEPKKGKK